MQAGPETGKTGRQRPLLLLAASIVAMIAARPSFAQRPLGALRIDNLSRGFFSASGAVLDATGEVALNFLGVARTPNGHYFLSSKRRTIGGQHELLEFDSLGRFLAVHSQPVEVQTDFLGLRDLAWDGAEDSGSRIWGGVRGLSVYGFDWAQGVFHPSDVRVLHGFEGVAIHNLAIAEIDGDPVFVAASAPALDTGPGFFGNRVNYHRVADGLPARNSTADVGSGAGKWGAAYDAVADVVWWHIDDAAGNPNPNGSRTVFKEMDMSTGRLTGQIFQGYRSLGGEANGCEFYQDRLGDGVMLSLVSSAKQMSPFSDAVVEMYARGQFGSPCGGEIRIIGEAFIGHSTWSLGLDAVVSDSGSQGILLQGPQVIVPGLVIPGILSCPLLLSPPSMINLGSAPIRRESATHPRPLPNDVGITGVLIAYQWLIFGDSPALPATLSDGVLVRIGTNF